MDCNVPSCNSDAKEYRRNRTSPSTSRISFSKLFFFAAYSTNTARILVVCLQAERQSLLVTPKQSYSCRCDCPGTRRQRVDLCSVRRDRSHQPQLSVLRAQ